MAQWRPTLLKTLSIAMLILLSAGISRRAAAAQCAAGRSDMAIGGTVGFDSLAQPNNIRKLLSTCRVRLYLHNYIWPRLRDDDLRRQILHNFSGIAPEAVEIIASSDARMFWDRFRQVYTSVGVNADQAHVDAIGKISAIQWRAFVDAGRAAGIKILSPIFAPNSGQWRDHSFDQSNWDDLKQRARYGGGLTVDAPPTFFLKNPVGYQTFVLDELRWARSTGIQATLIISPNVSKGEFLAHTQTMLKMLEKERAIPTFYVIENYRPLPVAPDYPNEIGNERNPANIAGVALWLAQNAPSLHH